MNVNTRGGRDNTGGERKTGQRAPRSGGRTTEQRAYRPGIGAPTPDRDARARGAREFPTQGNAALRARDADPSGGFGRAVRVWDSSAESDIGEARASAAAPRLKVAPPRPVSVPRAPFVALILVVVVGGVLGILLVNTRINENAFRLDKLQKQQATLDLRQQQLEKEIAEHEAPGNLEAAARKLGLVESGPPAFIRLPDGKVIGVPQPAQGDPSITSQQGSGASR